MTCRTNPEEEYCLLCRQMESLLDGEEDWVSVTANAAALLYGALPDINWVGFYRVKGGELLLGPFEGKPACVHIPLGKGVCGTAAFKGTVLLVPDVHRFSGHIACDSASASELAIPLRGKGKVIGVLDIDSPVRERFQRRDADSLQKIADIVSAHCVRSMEGT